MFGRRKINDAGSASAQPADAFVDDLEDGDLEDGNIDDGGTDGTSDSLDDTSPRDEGPHDLGDLDDDRETVAKTRLDLGSVLIPLPAGGQLQVEMSEAGSPQAVHIVTQYGRITVAAYAAPKSSGQWREVAADLAGSLRSDKAETSVETGPWGRELVGVTTNADLRFIGVDGYRWMLRCVLAGPAGSVSEGQPLVQLAHTILRQTVVDRGTDPHPVRTPLPVVLPQVLAEQLAAAAQQQQVAQQQAAQQPATQQPATQPSPAQQSAGAEGAAADTDGQEAQTQARPDGAAQSERPPRRGASGSAIQQLGG